MRISLFGESGQLLWNQDDGNVWHVEVTSPSRTKPAVIVHSNAGGLLTVRAESGETLHQIKLPVYLSQFCLCRYPTTGDDQCVLACAKGKLYVFDTFGKEVDSLPVPLIDDLNKIVSTLVRLDPAQPTFLTTVISWKRWKRSLLCVHDASGKLVYEEVLADLCCTVMGLPEDDEGRESLLIGTAGRIWKYEAFF